MPSPTDRVSTALRQSIAEVSKKAGTGSNGEHLNLDTALADRNILAEIKKHRVEYESSDNQQCSTQNAIKAKYVVLDAKVMGAQNVNGSLVNGNNGSLVNGNKANNGSTSGPQSNGIKGNHQNGLCYANFNGGFKTSNTMGSMNGTKKPGCNGIVKGIENGSPKPASSCDSSLPEPKHVLYHPDLVTLGWQKNFRAGAGMVNLGNTCYLNATLQALFHVPAFVEWLLNDDEHMKKCEQINGPNFGDCITCSMSRTLRASHSNATIKPQLITSKIKMICRHMSHGSQEDAHEFMRHLLENMEKAYLIRCKAQKMDAFSKETTPINQIFGGYIRTEVKCLRCAYASTTFQHFQDLILDIRKASKVEDAMDQYFSKEKLDGENSYKCEKCKCGVPATKKYYIERPPKVLCIQLKRFNAIGVKIPKPVEHKFEMDLKRYIHSQSAYASYSSLPYRLISMVTHVGPSSGCGHYTAIAQCSSRTFHQFDDTHVHPVSNQSVMNNCAYILIYEMDPQASRQGPKAAASSSVASTSTLGQTNHNIMNGTSKSTPTTSGGLPSAKDRERVAFGLATPKPAAVPPRIVMHKNVLNSVSSAVKPPSTQNGVVNKEARVSNFIGPVQVASNGKHLGSSSLAKDILPASGILRQPDPVALSHIDSSKKDLGNLLKSLEPEKKHVGSLVPYDCDDDSSSRDSSLSPPLNDDHEVLTVKATKPGDWQVTNSSGLRSPSIHSESSNHSVASATGSNWNVTDKQSSVNSLGCKNGIAQKGLDKKVQDCSPSAIIHSSDLEAERKPVETCLPRAKSVERELYLGETSNPSKHAFSAKKTRVRRHSVSSESDSSSCNKAVKKKMKSSGVVEDNGVPKHSDSIGRLGQQSTLIDKLHVVDNTCSNTAENSRSNVAQHSASSSFWNGGHSKTVHDLLRMSHQGFGNDRVALWNGEQSQVERSVEDDKQASWKRSRDEYEMELDRGRMKKVKKDNHRWKPYPQSFPNRSGQNFNQNRKFNNNYSNAHHRFKNRPNNHFKWQSDHYKSSNSNHRYYRN